MKSYPLQDLIIFLIHQIILWVGRYALYGGLSMPVASMSISVPGYLDANKRIIV